MLWADDYIKERIKLVKTHEAKANLLQRISKEILKNCDLRKCNNISDGIISVGSLVVGILFAVGGMLIHWGLIIVGIALSFLIVILWLATKSVIAEREDEQDNELKTIKDNYDKLRKEYAALEKKKESGDALLIETTLIAKEIHRVQGDNNAKRLYTKLANSISEMILAIKGLTKEQFSVYIYIYDGISRKVRRTEVSTCVTTLQTANETGIINIDDVSNYYYAKCILDKKTTFFLSDNQAIRNNFYFDSSEDSIISHYTQYAAMSYKLGDRMELYAEVISYDEAKLGGNEEELEKFVSQVLSPFSSLVSIVDWRKVRSGLE